jgi:cell division protein FtsZ
MSGHASENTVIKVVGVGGAGGNAVQHMIEQNVPGVTFISANTDAQALNASSAPIKIQIGKSGLGAGMKPDIGRQLAQESRAMIEEQLRGAHMVFIAAGMGGGTGTGAAPIIAQVAKEQGALVVGVVSKPFSYEGGACMAVAESGLEELTKHVDSLIVILNEKLEVIYEDDSLKEWLEHADNVLHNAVAGIAEIINVPGHINVDFNDVKTIMGSKGKAMMGIGTACGEARAVHAAEEAIASPLLDGTDLSGASGILVNVTCSRNVKGREIKEIMSTVKKSAAEDAQIAQGIAYDDNMGDSIRVTVVATGIGNHNAQRRIPLPTMASQEGIAPSALPLRQGAQAGEGTHANGTPAVWRSGQSKSEAVSALKRSGMEDLEIPAFLRKEARLENN